MTLSIRTVTSLVLAAAVVVPAVVHAQPVVTASAAYSTVGVGTQTATGRWDYTFTFSHMCPPCGDGAFAQISIELPSGVSVRVNGEETLWVLTTSGAGAATFTRRSDLADGITLKVRAEALLSAFSAGTVKWTSAHNGSATPQANALQGPTAKPAPKPGWSTVIGGGLSYLQDDYTDFELDNDVLVIKNNSHLRATALTGVIFDLGAEAGLLVGLEYTAGTSALLDAFSAGFTYRIGSNASLVLGLSRAKGRELSPGFERAAAAYVTANPDKFPGITSKADGSGLGSLDAYDGLPLKDIGYQGRPITDSWNTSFFVGVAFPISIKLGSDKDRAQLTKTGSEK